MQIPTKKLRNGFEMPVFGLGTWQMGGRHEHNPDNDDEADIAAIKHAIEAGITHLDTAESYADGYAEVLLGRAIQGYDRKKLLIVSKVKEAHLHYHDVIAAAQRSLERLRIEYVDLYLIHAPNPEIPIAETMRAMDELKKRGWIKNIGVSNFTIERLRAAQACTKNRIVANQLQLNLQYREVERKGLVEFCQTHDVMFIAWRPVQKGVLTVAGSPLFSKMCQKYSKTPSQVAINWLISQKNIVTLSKMRSAEHLQENLGALGWTMEPADIKLLRTQFPDQKDTSDAVPLI